jgi:FMN phosphatase YigB (HAD superfamily)
MKRVHLAVFDLDNTLYDWYASFIPAFFAMVDLVVQTFPCDREVLLDELRDVHRRYHDVEHPFSVLETPTIQTIVEAQGQEEVWRRLDPAFHAFNRIRKHNLRLFAGAHETLLRLKGEGIKLVAFTDSSYHSTLRRVRQLELGTIFEHVFCRAKAELGAPRGTFMSQHPPSDTLAEKTIELPAEQSKPDPAVLIDIANQEQVSMDLVAYMGDSISRDVLMAKKAGCYAVWAKYGVRRDPRMYEQLVRISHWSNEDISRERRFAEEARKVMPDFVCETSIVEVLNALTGPATLSASQAN